MWKQVLGGLLVRVSLMFWLHLKESSQEANLENEENNVRCHIHISDSVSCTRQAFVHT